MSAPMRPAEPQGSPRTGIPASALSEVGHGRRGCRRPGPDSAPADIALTRKGERYAIENAHLDPLIFGAEPLPRGRALARLRHAAEAEIGRLVEILDKIDGDPDLEDGDEDDDPSAEEPLLGWTSTLNQASRHRLGEGGDLEQADEDREEDDAGEAIGDEEASLGWEHVILGHSVADGSLMWPGQSHIIDDHFDQSGAGKSGSTEDLEADYADNEPALGSISCVGSCRGIDAGVGMIDGVVNTILFGHDWNQTFWAGGATNDGELQDWDYEEDHRDAPTDVDPVKWMRGRYVAPKIAAMITITAHDGKRWEVRSIC